MSRRLAGVCTLLALLPLASCGEVETVPEIDLGFEVDVGASTVELGRAFPLTVTRVHLKALDVAPWDESTLAPLRLELESESRTQDAQRVRSVRRYRAYAFTTQDVRIPAPKMVGTAADGSERVVRAETVRLRVRSPLPPGDDSAPELPGDPAPPTAAIWPWILALLVLVAGLAALLLARRRRAAVPAPTPEPVPEAPAPADVALERLAALRRSDAPAPARVLEASSIVRDYVAERFGVPARELTTEELVARSGEHGAALAGVLSRCDFVKFAGGAASPSDVLALVDDAAALVEGTRA